MSGMLLVEENPAAELLRAANERSSARTEILHKLIEIDTSISDIKDDVNEIQYQIGVGK